MIPDSTEITAENGTVRWRNDDFMISLDEAEEIGSKLRELITQPSTERVLVDNREADGTWPSEVNEYWVDVMSDMYEHGIDCATVTPSKTNAIQINRLSRDAGTDDRIKAFEASEYDDALAFLGIDD